MTGHFICDRCGDEGHSDWCVYLRPVADRWKGHRTKEEMAELKAEAERQKALALTSPDRQP